MIKDLLDCDRPFLIEHLRLDESEHKFVPAARLQITPQARTSGFLRRISGRQAHILLAFFTYLTANGHLYVTAGQVAAALGIPTPVAALWLRRFCQARFQGNPIIHPLGRKLGPEAFTLSHTLIHYSAQPPATPFGHDNRTGSRDAVINHSRARYATPAKNVEPIIMRQLGHHPEEALGTPEAGVWEELRYLKVRREDIQSLLDTFGVERILQQLAWLPSRPGRNRARVLITSLLKNEGPPRRLQDVLRNAQFDTYRNADSAPDTQDGEKGADV